MRKEDNLTRGEHAERDKALAASMPIPDYEPDLVHGTKTFSRSAKNVVTPKPNHLGRGLKSDLPEDF